MRTISALLIGLSLAACGGRERDEGEDAPPECTKSIDCAETEVCAVGRCVAALGRKFQITVKSAKISSKAVDTGETPDTFVMVKLNGTELGQTKVVEDSMTPTWNESFEFVLAENAELTFTLTEARDGAGYLRSAFKYSDVVNFVRKDEVAVHPSDGYLEEFLLSTKPL